MTDSAIERYLDELFVELRASAPREARWLLGESEGHLRDVADEAERTGLSRAEAELVAIQRFGDAHQLAATDRRRSSTPVMVRVALSGWSLGCIGAMAVGGSGVIAGLMRLFGASTTFIAGNGSTTNLRPADCARWLAGDPHAPSCAQAALNDWTWEIIGYRIAIGVFGALAFATLAVARRRSNRLRAWRPLPPAVVDAIATTIFGIGGLWLTGLGVDAWVVRSGHGAGFWLSASPVALAAGVLFGRRLVHDIKPAA